MAVSSSTNRNRYSWSDEVGLLPLFLTLILPLVIGVIVLLKCVYNHCCLRKATAKSYTVKPTLKSWKERQEDETRHPPSEEIQENENQPSTSSGSAPNIGSQNPTEISVETEESNVTGGRNSGVVNDSNHPVPPRRGSSQWRRSHPQTQAQQISTNDNQVNFSGDSQDSRGYTRISVREPLSNIRNQAVQRNSDSPHYATVSDDSEEMYAAIEDGEGNYMRIPGDDSRNWQERREANSPLPPVPPPISPVLMPGSEVLPSTSSSTQTSNDPIALVPIQPPIYAQVTKSKKTKAPIPPTPSLSIASTSSHTHVQLPLDPPIEIPPPLITSSKKRTTHHQQIEPPEVPSESRRWSKADISYSEFEVIREPPFPSTSKSKQIVTDLIDEDNYNLIVDVRSISRLSSRQNDNSIKTNTSISRTMPRLSVVDPHHPYSAITKPSSSQSHSEDPKRYSYTEVSKRNSSHQSDENLAQNPYSELTRRSSPPGYYQEIGEPKVSVKKRDNLYQKIRRKVGEGDDSDDEDEDEDQFYEKVKINPTSSASCGNVPPPITNPNALKHGYEKIKPKSTKGSENSALPPKTLIPIESDEDGSLYEQVKYPPYERLKESQDNLQDDKKEHRDNLYEDIGYSRIKKSTKSSTQQVSTGASNAAGAASSASPPSPVNVDNLYARVDKTKKRKKEITSLGIQSTTKSQDEDNSIEYI